MKTIDDFALRGLRVLVVAPTSTCRWTAAASRTTAASGPPAHPDRAEDPQRPR